MASTANNKRMFEIASLQLIFEKAVETNPEEELLNNILEKSSEKFELRREVVKELFERIGISLISQVSVIKDDQSLS